MGNCTPSRLVKIVSHIRDLRLNFLKTFLCVVVLEEWKCLIDPSNLSRSTLLRMRPSSFVEDVDDLVVTEKSVVKVINILRLTKQRQR